MLLWYYGALLILIDLRVFKRKLITDQINVQGSFKIVSNR